MLPKVITKLAVASVVWASVILAMAQAEHPLPRPQARSEEKFDLYLEFLETVDPEARHEMAIRFERSYPKSELSVNVYESEFEYARSHERLRSAIAAAEKALRLEPDEDVLQRLKTVKAGPRTARQGREFRRRGQKPDR